MEDYRIVELFWARDEAAIRQSDSKYGRMLTHISFSMLSSREDAEECVSDTYIAAWNNMPSDRPDYLGAYLSKIVRRISVNRIRHRTRQKRGGGGVEQLIEELAECIPDGSAGSDVTADYENGRLRDALNSFLASLDGEKRVIFVKRYFCSEPLADIAEQLDISEGKVKTVLFRTREALKKLLEKEDLL